jgi:hypothetical protein
MIVIYFCDELLLSLVLTRTYMFPCIYYIEIYLLIHLHIVMPIWYRALVHPQYYLIL